MPERWAMQPERMERAATPNSVLVLFSAQLKEREKKKIKVVLLRQQVSLQQAVCGSLLMSLPRLTTLVFSFPFYQAGGFIDMFGMMNDMIGNMVRTLHEPFCIEGSAEDASAIPLMSFTLLCCLGWTEPHLPRWQRL